MHSTRSWQDSFDRLERSRREEQRLREVEERQLREAEVAYARASLDASYMDLPSLAEMSDSMPADRQDARAEVLVTAKAPAASPTTELAPAKSSPAKSPGNKSSPGKRAAPRRKALTAKSRTAKAPTAKPRTAGPKVAKSVTPRGSVAKQAVAAAGPPEALASNTLVPIPAMSTPPAISLPRAPQPASAETFLITPLPRSAALSRYRKPGLFGLIGAWLRLAARRPKLPENLRNPARLESPPRDDVAALRAENKRLRQELEALKALQEVHRAQTPPWATASMPTPAGDVLARPRRRERILR